LKYGHRLVIDTILYVLVSGCAWRLAPYDLAPWDAAYRWFRLWSAAVLDSRSAKSASGGEQIGYDAGNESGAVSGTCSSTRWDCC